MFDNPLGGFLDSPHFVGTGARRQLQARVLVLVCLIVGAAGCTPRRAPDQVAGQGPSRVPETPARTPGKQPGKPEESLTSGRISVVCSPELVGILERERAVFDSLYPGATIELKAGSSSAAVRSLFAAECDLAVISRELDPVERSAAVRGGLELEGYRFARDGVALVVHPGNRVENAALDQVRGIFEGTLKGWEGLGGGAGEIEPVIQAPTSDIMAFFTAKVLDGGPIRAPVVYGATDSGVVSYVKQHPGAIGVVSMAWAERGAKPLRLATLRGLTYRKPDAETVHEGVYPLARDMNLYVRPKGPPLANGFITFITSRDGQVIVRDLGLVPTAVPVRFVRRSPMMGSHR